MYTSGTTLSLPAALPIVRVGGRHRLAGKVVVVIVLVAVDREDIGLRTEQAPELGVSRDLVRTAGTADMAVHAQHPVGRRHHHVQVVADHQDAAAAARSEEHTSELQSLMRISYAVFCLKKNTKSQHNI